MKAQQMIIPSLTLHYYLAQKSNKINLLIGVRNLLNVEYIPHLSRLKSYEIPHLGAFI